MDKERVKEIRYSYLACRMTLKQLSKQYDISMAKTHKIITNECYPDKNWQTFCNEPTYIKLIFKMVYQDGYPIKYLATKTLNNALTPAQVQGPLMKIYNAVGIEPKHRRRNKEAVN